VVFSLGFMLLCAFEYSAFDFTSTYVPARSQRNLSGGTVKSDSNLLEALSLTVNCRNISIALTDPCQGVLSVMAWLRHLITTLDSRGEDLRDCKF